MVTDIILRRRPLPAMHVLNSPGKLLNRVKVGQFVAVHLQLVVDKPHTFARKCHAVRHQCYLLLYAFIHHDAKLCK